MTAPEQPVMGALTEDEDGPECDLCGRTGCPDADLPEFSEPVNCDLTPIYNSLRYDRCDYGCGRDLTKASIRVAARDLERILAARSQPPAERAGGDAVAAVLEVADTLAFGAEWNDLTPRKRAERWPDKPPHNVSRPSASRRGVQMVRDLAAALSTGIAAEEPRVNLWRCENRFHDVTRCIPTKHYGLPREERAAPSEPFRPVVPPPPPHIPVGGSESTGGCGLTFDRTAARDEAVER